MENLSLDKSALIIQDLQNDVIIKGGAFTDSGAHEHAKKQNIIENVKTLSNVARKAGIPVIHIHYIVEKNAFGLKQNAPLFQGVKEGKALVRGTWGAEPVKGLEPKEGDIVVEKMRMNGFYNTKLDTILRGLGVDTIIITGAWTNMSIEHTARHGADAGYKIVVASNGTSTINEEWQNVALNYALKNVGQSISCTEIQSIINKSVKTPIKNKEKPVKFNVLIDKNASVEKIATGFIFTEGPIWNKEGSFLLFSDMPGDTRRRYIEKNGVEEIMKPSNKCNGMTYDKEGNLIICEHATSSLICERKYSKREIIASHYKGKELNSPNDVIVARDGLIYFTDPSYGRCPGFGVEREQELNFQGVYRVLPNGNKLQLLVDDFEQPNGLCFSPDESLLYINDTPRAHIRVFDVRSDGNIKNGRIFFDKIGNGIIEEGVPDGMKCDEYGNIYVTGPGGIWIISPEGEYLGLIKVPENVGNINWGGSDWNILYIAASTSVYRIQMKVSGNRLCYMH